MIESVHVAINLFKSTRGNKELRVEEAIKNVFGIFTQEDIRKACPDISESTINRIFTRLKEENIIKVLGQGRSAKWRKLV